MDTITEQNLLNLVPPPVQPWRHKTFEEANIKVDVLRLDLIHPVIGGNKWMKLKGFFGKAMMEGKAGILTKGGPWSNHLHACAWMCYQLGLPCTIWVKGNSRITNLMLEDVANWNATILFINRSVFYDEAKATDYALANRLRYAPMGGAEETGVQHVSHFIEHLNLPVYDYAICAVGTATTLGGIAFVPDNFNSIIGIEAGTGDDFLKQKIMQWQQLLPQKTLSLNKDYIFGGFARHMPELIQFMNELFVNHQIPTDIVYTGKLFYGVLQLAEKKCFSAGAKLLIIHSGGLQGNRSLSAGTLQF